MASPFLSATAGRGCTALRSVTAWCPPSHALAGAAIVAALNSACGERPLEPRPPDPGAPHFTVMSFNIELGAKREPSTLRSIGELDADLVGLQEVTPEAEAWLRVAYADQYPYQLYQSKGGAGGLAALSRFPLVDHGLRPAPEDWHPAWHFEAETPAGSVQVLDVHLRSLFSGDSNPVRSYLSTGSDHRNEMELFSDWCEQSIPTIVLGDFNESPDGPAIHYLEGRGFFNLLPAFRPGQPTWRFRSTGDQFSETFDHILINPELVPLNAWVQRRGESDHLPVLAHLEPRSW